MGRPTTPSPGEGGGDSRGKAGSSLWMVLIGIVSLVLGIVAVAVPYWGFFSPQSSYIGSGRGINGYIEGGGYFGPFHPPCRYASGGYHAFCDGTVNFRTEIYLTIGGVCAVVGVVSTALFTIFAGLHCAMQVNNKHIVLKYKQNIFAALCSIVVADIASVLAVVLGALQFTTRTSQYRLSMGACYIIEIVLILVNLILLVMCFMSYKKAKKVNFPRQGSPYEISATTYEHGPVSHGGIAVTHQSGQQYPGPPQSQLSQLTTSQLPQFPAPPPPSHHQTPVFQGPYINNGHNGHVNNGYSTMNGQMYNPTGQLAQPQVQTRPVPVRENVSGGVNLNPEGRVSYHPLKGPGQGSMDSLNSTQSSVLSYGSTGSYSSNGMFSMDMVNGRKYDISNPIRSSLKKPKNKDNNSVASGVSKKSVTIAIGAEQTAV